jgi:peptide/nickel transport system substrate-binding protein
MTAAFAAAIIALSSAGAGADPKTTLVIGAAVDDVGKLDPHLSAVGADKALMNWMFNALVRIKPGQSNPAFIEPDLAESWSSNEAGTEWIFKIRQGVQCHYGYGEFTAEDAAYSLKRSANKETSSFSGDFAALADAQAVDKYTLKVTLKNAIPSLPGLVSNYHGGMMVCKKAAEEAGADFLKRPIGTGPFMFVEYQPQQFVKLTANKDYFRGAPKLQEIVYRYIPSDATRDLAFQSGEVDMIFGQQTDAWVKRMTETKGVEVHAMEPAELSSLYLNRTIPPLDDIRVRQAFLYAIDRKEFAQFIGSKVAREPISVIPRGNIGTATLDLPAVNIEKAEELLREAGHPDGITVKSIASTHPALLRIIQAAQGQLRKAGINLELETVDHPTYHAQIRKDLSAVTLYQAARFPVDDVYLTQFFDSKSTVNTPTGVVNFSHCSVADADIAAARTEQDPEKQKALWAAAQKKILDDVCSVPLVETLVIWAWRSTLDIGYDMVGSLNLGPQITEQTHFTE